MFEVMDFVMCQKKEETERGYTEEQRLKLRAENAIKEAEIFVNTFIEKKGEYNGV